MNGLDVASWQYAAGDLAEACEIPGHMASEHLRRMQRCGFLAAEKDRRFLYYSRRADLANVMTSIESRFGVESIR